MRLILEKQSMHPRIPAAVLACPALSEVQALLPDSKRHSLWAIDLETKGVEAHQPESEIIGIGFADQDSCFYIDLRGASDDVVVYLKDYLSTTKLVAFNTNFDSGFLYRWTGKWLNWVGCSFGLYKQLSTESYPGQKWNLASAETEILGWPASNKESFDQILKEHGYGKDQMWRLPADKLGTYCAGDADAAWQLWGYLTSKCTVEPFDNWLRFHQREFITEVQLLVEQQFRGLMVDQDRLMSCRAANDQRIATSMDSFLNHPLVAHHIAVFNDEVRAAWKRAEPPHTTAKGEVSKRWLAWRDREYTYLADNGFNPNSKNQLADLFYNKLGYKPFKFTPTGRPAIDRKVLPALGEPGKILAEYNLYTKRRGYIAATVEKSARDGLIHPQFNSMGTITTRLGGSGGWSAHQMPKTVDFLYSLRARPGMKLVQADAESLEPTILAEFSKDRSLWSIYGPGAPANDIYLFIASKLEALGAEIRKYYDPDHPTPESIKLAKKHCKAQRDLAKKIHLMCAYGAGPEKIHGELILAGIEITLREVKAMHRQYWRIFADVRQFGERLKDMWASNGGWIPTVLGTPIAVTESLLRDVNNRFCQTSGHQILQTWIYHIHRLRLERGVEMYPWLVDNQDETSWESPEDQAQAAAQVLEDALAAVNAELGMDIPIKGPAAIADNLAEIKCSDTYPKWLAEQTEKQDDAA